MKIIGQKLDIKQELEISDDFAEMFKNRPVILIQNTNASNQILAKIEETIQNSSDDIDALCDKICRLCHAERMPLKDFSRMMGLKYVLIAIELYGNQDNASRMLGVSQQTVSKKLSGKEL